MAFQLPKLLFDTAALEPHISKRTMEFHYGKHHAAYVNKANDLIKGTHYEKMTLEDVIRDSASKTKDRALFQSSAQIWNHSFFWNCMQPQGGGEPKGDIAKQLQKFFGGYAEFRQKFVETAVGQFGSGWAWLVVDSGQLAIVATPDAETPLTMNQVPLLTCDVWEHAYYLDYQNRRPDFVNAFLDHLVNWEHAETCLRKADRYVLPHATV
jgi:Fe-Mn family superoxide dismutase